MRTDRAIVARNEKKNETSSQHSAALELLPSRTYWVANNGRGKVDDAVAATEGGAQAGSVEQVNPHHGQPLPRAVERPQVRVLGVISGAAGGAPDGVAAGEEQLDDPGPDEASGAGDAHEDGHGQQTPIGRTSSGGVWTCGEDGGAVVRGSRVRTSHHRPC